MGTKSIFNPDYIFYNVSLIDQLLRNKIQREALYVKNSVSYGPRKLAKHRFHTGSAGKPTFSRTYCAHNLMNFCIGASAALNIISKKSLFQTNMVKKSGLKMVCVPIVMSRSFLQKNVQISPSRQGFRVPSVGSGLPGTVHPCQPGIRFLQCEYSYSCIHTPIPNNYLVFHSTKEGNREKKTWRICWREMCCWRKRNKLIFTKAFDPPTA